MCNWFYFRCGNFSRWRYRGFRDRFEWHWLAHGLVNSDVSIAVSLKASSGAALQIPELRQSSAVSLTASTGAGSRKRRLLQMDRPGLVQTRGAALQMSAGASKALAPQRQLASQCGSSLTLSIGSWRFKWQLAPQRQPALPHTWAFLAAVAQRPGRLGAISVRAGANSHSGAEARSGDGHDGRRCEIGWHTASPSAGMGAGALSAIGSDTVSSNGSGSWTGAFSRGMKFSTAAPLPAAAIVPPFPPNGRLIFPKGTAARRTDGSEALSWSETCGGPPARRAGAAIFWAGSLGQPHRNAVPSPVPENDKPRYSRAVAHLGDNNPGHNEQRPRKGGRPPGPCWELHPFRSLAGPFPNGSRGEHGSGRGRSGIGRATGGATFSTVERCLTVRRALCCADFCGATSVDAAGAVAGICSGSRGRGARVSEGNAFDSHRHFHFAATTPGLWRPCRSSR